VSAWSWGFLVCKFSLNEVYRLGASGEAVVLEFLLLVFVLNSDRVTAPGPGIF